MRSIAGSAFTVLTVLSLAASAAFAQMQDVEGSSDHPIVSRYAGSIVIGYDARDFDEFVLPLGPVKRRITEDYRTVFEPTDSQTTEGKVTRILYVAPANRSSLEVLRNYEQELGRAGFQRLYACAGAECVEGSGRLSSFLYDGKHVGDELYTKTAFNFYRDQRYWAGKLARPEGDVYASVYVATQTFDQFPETNDHPLVLLDVIETVPMETGMVTVDAAAMARDIDASGRVALYGIHFDTNKADIKPESEPTLAEVAALLEGDPALKLYVVGHTDDVGGYEYNMNLSERRAAAVVEYLKARHGIFADRLRPAGVGLLAPVAPNDSEEGRAKNRRVELVRQ